ncbi:gustatory and odorant receptor 63a [Halyomorpha halys]|uniref:gustatory and odorant receptor 63a n=1 Tax=Halyomorpha halys TaxID=286706 RepID=UPI0034D2650A
MAYEYLPSVYIRSKDAEESTTKYSKRRSEVSVLYQVLEPILLLMRLAGRFPYAINQKPDKEMHCGWAVYSAAVGVLQFAGVYFTSNLSYSLSLGNFDEQIFATVTTIVCFILGLNPFLTWFEAPWLSAYLDKWSAYQDELRSFDVILDTRLQKWLLLWILALFPYTAVVAYFLDVRRGDPTAFPVYLLLQIGSYLLLTLWFFMVFFIEDTASRLLARIGDASAEREVAILKKLWLTLANLTTELGHVLSLTLILFMISCSIIGIANCYSLLFFLRDCFLDNCDSSSYQQIPIISQVGTLIVSAIIIIAICEHGHRCTVSVGSNFLKEILKINFSLRNENTQRELHSLVQTILLRYPDMALGCYFTVNRRLLATMVTTAITYLIVLLQFRSTGIKT